MGFVDRLMSFGFLPDSRHSNGNGHAVAVVEEKAVPVQAAFLAPSGMRNSEIVWLDGRASADSRDVNSETAYTIAALAFICINYRAKKLAEAPVWVVNQTKDGEDWIEDHPIDALLEEPNPDFSMADMQEITSIYRDTTGRCLWVKNRDNAGRVASMYAFAGDEFESFTTADRLYGRFEVQTRTGKRSYGPEDVVLFHNFRPGEPHRGLATIDPALSHLNISQELKQRIKYMLRNAAAPGGIYALDKDANVDDAEFERIKLEIGRAYTAMNTGNTMVLDGGGTFTRTAYTLKELALGDLWRENEAMVCACFGIPTALVGVVVGIENSPWSHLSIVKKNVEDDTIAPLRSKIEIALTRQLLRESDTNRRHVIRFDTSRIRALQVDQITKSQIAVNLSRMLSLNQRLRLLGMPQSTDARANLVPELEFPNAGATPSPAATPPGDAEPRASGPDKAHEALLETMGVMRALADRATDAQPISVNVPVTVVEPKQGSRSVAFNRNANGELMSADITVVESKQVPRSVAFKRNGNGELMSAEIGGDE